MDTSTALLRQLFDTAVSAVSPQACMPDALSTLPEGKIIVIGAGKAAASMAFEVEKRRPGDVSGLVIVPYGHGVTCEYIEVIEAAHPLPDEAGVAASRRILELVAELSEPDHVLCLISGGGSSLMTLPADGITLAEKQELTHALLTSGAAISEINCVRKHMSAIKGGKLAAACWPARVRTLLISDVPGNDVSVIASGPTVHDNTTPADALEILRRYSIELPGPLRSVFENPTTTNAAFVEDVTVLATSDDAIAAAVRLAESNNYATMNLGDLEGDARELAGNHAGLAKKIADGGGPFAAPMVILSGGETTLEVTGSGHGGRNSEYALALAIALDAHPKISAIVCDTDGIDGTGDNAGCLVLPDTLARASSLSMDALAYQANNDSYNFFAALDDLVVTGPTRTNVNDFRAILIEAPENT